MVDTGPPQWAVVHRDWDGQTWVATIPTFNRLTQTAETRTESFAELACGLNYRDADGAWQPTRELFEINADGSAAARFGPHKVNLPANLAAPDGIDVVTPDGVHLRLQVIGLGWYDPVSGRSVLLAELQDSTGELTAPNEVTYRRAFDGAVVKFKNDGTSEISQYEGEFICRTGPYWTAFFTYDA